MITKPASTDLNQLYDKKFFNQFKDEVSFRSAKEILDLVFQIVPAKKVLDVGCGAGDWLAAANGLGATTLTGIEGPWQTQNGLVNKQITLFTHNLEDPLPSDISKHDLVVCVEVAEHLSFERANSFVDDLCRASDCIVFGAAIPTQPGTNHINLQWPSFWIEKFQKNGFQCWDIIRPAVWHNENVVWWYKQNTFLFICEKAKNALQLEKFQSMQRPIRDMVHPEFLKIALEKAKFANVDRSFLSRLKRRLHSWISDS